MIKAQNQGMYAYQGIYNKANVKIVKTNLGYFHCTMLMEMFVIG